MMGRVRQSWTCIKKRVMRFFVGKEPETTSQAIGVELNDEEELEDFVDEEWARLVLEDLVDDQWSRLVLEFHEDVDTGGAQD